MNKQEKLFACLLGLALLGWMVYSTNQAKERAKRIAQNQVEAVATQETAAPAPEKEPVLSAPAATPAPLPAVPAAATLPPPDKPEKSVQLKSAEGDLLLDLSSHGAVIRRATLTAFAENPGKPDPEKNPPVALNFSDAPALELAGMPGLPQNMAYELAQPDAHTATFTAKTGEGLEVTRQITVGSNYVVHVKDVFKNAGDQVLSIGTNSVCMGTMPRGSSKNDTLSMDSLPNLPKAKVRFWDREKSTKKLMAGMAGGGFGCSGAPSAVGLPDTITIPVTESQNWIALKSRFFASIFTSSATNDGFTVTLARDLTKQTYFLNTLSARVYYTGGTLAQGETLTRDYTLFIGPKKLSLLSKMGNQLDEIMQFGMFAWFCKLLVPTLNFFYRIVPNYGIAIILLTFLVRIIFWPLTRKSTEGMKRMQEIQPKLKEIQAKFKDNPQKMQQETFAVYRENKVNPFSSCLPMLIQIPVFIALFTVLRSAVELRYAPFLWIIDLSEPENLLAGVLPIPLNILPILMAATMALQSYLTPSGGDPQQQKIMMVMMPIMMLLMFYSFPSALSLYWTVSQVLSIIQMVMIHRQSQKKETGATPDNTRLTRQQRRHA
ncbi:MAG: YidC/Oxa1 family insertase periplasmic-domain containing protein [Kiritimatiellae bacterium]|nr:YidC/Oxa1 family insertase periplasmic-domain containing protein [Kiritimatiellia bacterium]